MVTEIVGLSKENRQPLSLFSHIHSSKEKSYKSTNTVTFNGLEKVIESINGKGTFVFDRGYDMNSMFQFMHEKDQYYIIRLTERRKLLKTFKIRSLPCAQNKPKGVEKIL